MEDGRKKRGRKSRIVPVRFSEEDYALLRREAERRRLPVSSLIRMVVVEAMRERGGRS